MSRFVDLLARALGAPLTAASPLQPADAIVVLGAPLLAGGGLTIQAEERVAVAVALWRRGIAPVICLVGGHGPVGWRHTEAEAEGMAREVRARGVPESAIRVDRKSACTFTNAQRAAEILLPEGRRRVWLVTQPHHLRRARWYFERAGFETLGFHIEDSIQYRMPRRALRWIAREYGAWVLALWRGATGEASRAAKGGADRGHEG